MLVVVLGPANHDSKRAFEVAGEEMADGEFSRAVAGEQMQRPHRQVEMVLPVECDEFRQHDRGEAVIDARRQRGQHLERLAIGAGQGGMETHRRLAQPLHDAERVEIVGGERQETSSVETGRNGRRLRGEMAEPRAVENLLQRRRGLSCGVVHMLILFCLVSPDESWRHATPACCQRTVRSLGRRAALQHKTTRPASFLTNHQFVLMISDDL